MFAFVGNWMRLLSRKGIVHFMLVIKRKYTTSSGAKDKPARKKMAAHDGLTERGTTGSITRKHRVKKYFFVKI